MKKQLFSAALCLLTAATLTAQEASTPRGVTLTGRPTGQKPFPLETYTELENPLTPSGEQWQKVRKVNLSWGSTDIRYKQEEPAAIARPSLKCELKAWRGERVSAQWVIWGDRDLKDLKFELQDLHHTNGRDLIPKESLFGGFVRYVMTDELNKDGRGGCGHRPDATLFDSTLVADAIDHITPSLDLKRHTTRSGWVRVWVPAEAAAGVYSGQVRISDSKGLIGTLELRVRVMTRTLPAPEDWTFHLDLWQNPFAVARYHGVEPWSREHFDLMRPYMELYRDAGGKVITASIIHKPWNAQTYDYFETMVTWMRKADGTWAFDYTIFDKWVEFMMELGIRDQINCYSMIPWRLSFRYFDQASNSMKDIQTKPGEEAYEQMWGAMLRSFARHLREKGWFGITHIAMDERPADVMKAAMALIRKADPEFKVSLAGALHEDLLDQIDDYCVALRMKFSEQTKTLRRDQGKVTTYYTSCEDPRPNTFTFCPPAECAWLGWYAAREQLDGYLRWALNSWPIEPLLDSRFYTWAAGDTYLIYPGARSSIRYERMIEGIQDYEKVQILSREYEQKGDRAAQKRLQAILSLFDEKTLEKTPAAEVVKKARSFVNR